MEHIRAAIQLIREDRVAALAGRVVYPLRRENPLPDIKNGAELRVVSECIEEW
jgi:hypothetical protein